MLARLLLACATLCYAPAVSAQPSLTVWNGAVMEGDTGTRNLSFTVTLAPASDETVTVEVNTGPAAGDVLAITDDSMPGGPDYQAVAGRTLTFEPGETSKTVNVLVNGDQIDEPKWERFKLNLSNAVNADIETRSAVGYIGDDDPLPRLTIRSRTLTEGDAGTRNMTFTAALSAATGQEVIFYFDIGDSTATEVEDYRVPFHPRPRQLIISGKRSQTQGTFEVEILGDTLVEGNETFRVELSNPVNVILPDTAITGTITDDDGVDPITNTKNPPTASDSSVLLSDDLLSIPRYVFKAGDFNFADADPDGALTSVRIVTLPLLGSLELADAPVTANQVVTKAQLDAGDLSFQPDYDGRGTGYASFTFRVDDGTAESVDTYVMTIHVAAVTYEEVARLVLVDTTTDNDFRNLATGPTVSADRSYGVRADVKGRAAVGSVVFSLQGPFAHQHTDDLTPYSLFGDVNGVAKGRSLPEGEYTVDAAAYAESGGTGRWLGRRVHSFTVIDAALPGVSRNLSAQANGRTQIDLAWDPPANDGGTPVTGYRIEVSDDGLTGWSDLEPYHGAPTYSHGGLSPGTTKHYRITAINVLGAGAPTAPHSATTKELPGANTAPSASNGSVTTNEDTPYHFGTDDFNFTDKDADDALVSVRIVTVPSAGSLEIDGDAVTANQVVTQTNFINGDPVFTPAANAHGSGYATFTFKVSDGEAESAEAYTMTIDVTAVNDAATGAPAISGTAAVDRTLTATKGTIEDADGASGALSWQWIRVDADGTSNPSDIGGATAATYTVAETDTGKRIRVRASFTDDGGTEESRKSDATGAVTAVTPPQVLSAPTNLNAAGGNEQVTLTWNAPRYDGRITGYEFRFCRVATPTDCSGQQATASGEAGGWTSTGSTTAHTVMYWYLDLGGKTYRYRLVNSSRYRFQVRAVAGNVIGGATDWVEGTPSALAPAASKAPEMTGSTSFTVTEGETGVATLTASDEDTSAEDLVWSRSGGPDESKFVLSETGVLTFASAKDYENPDDSGTDGTYDVTVRASDGTNSATADLTVTLRNRNEAPSAEAGTNQESINGGAKVSLHGTGTDPDAGETLTYAWSQAGGTSVTLSSASSATASFTAPSGLTSDETLTFRLTVTDGGGLSAKDETNVTVQAAPSDPDGTRGGATRLNANAAARSTQHSAALDALDTAAGDRVDYYVFTIGSHKEMGLGVRDQSIDLDATLEDSSGNTVKRSWPPPADSRVEWLLATLDPGTYYIRIEAAEEGATRYRIRFGLKDPVAVSVADARTEEGQGASLDFEVTLDRSAARLVPILVRYRTVNGSAVAGADYTATSGALTFERGEMTKTVSVPVLDDDHDEKEETLTLRLSSAAEAIVSDGEATGTITNSDPLPKALLARFGRTAAAQVVEHVEERLTAAREPGFRGQFAGRELRRGMEQEMVLSFLSQLGGVAGMDPAGPDRHGPLSGATGGGTSEAVRSIGVPVVPIADLTVSAARMGAGTRTQGGRLDGGLLSMALGHDPLSGSAFQLNRDTSHGGVLSLWSRSARSHFGGQEGLLSLGGDVRTTVFGADYAKGPLVTGLSLGHSRGLGEYGGATGGRVASTVTGLYPWLGYRVTGRITVWGVAGYGSGGMLLTPDGAPALNAGLSMAMAAVGTRGELAAGGPGGIELAFKADALWVGTSTEGVVHPAGRLAATEAAVTRFRTRLEGSRDYTLGGRLSLRPMIEVGLRHDGGDAETGAGMDTGGGIVIADAETGLAVDVRMRVLMAHQAEGFRDRGVALSLIYNPTPSSPLGFTARVAPSWGGQAAGGAASLWGRETMGAMARGGVAQGVRLDSEVGYGLPVGNRMVGTPRVSFSASEYGRDYRVGYGLGVLNTGSLRFELGIDAHRRENTVPGGTDNGVIGRAKLDW